MRHLPLALLDALSWCLVFSLSSCGSEESACVDCGAPGSGGAAGTDGAAGAGGSAGSGGTAGNAGSGGGADGGAAGTGGTSGTGGAAGAGGTAGAGGAAGTGGSAWTEPACDTVEGTGAVTFTRDQGATLMPMSETLSGIVYTMGLAAMDEPNVLLAASEMSLLRSTDAGCHWTEVATLPMTLMQLVPAPGGVAYGFADNYAGLVRIDGTTVVSLPGPGAALHGLVVDRSDGLHLRVGDDVGQLHESFDGGETWATIGVPVTGFVYTVAFDPEDLNRVVMGRMSTSVAVSHDGGESWQDATGVGTNGQANAFSARFSPADHDVVWVQGIDLGTGIGNEKRWIWRSVDGGLTFTAEVEESPDVTLTNGILLAPHPTDQNVLYFDFGTYFQGYGTDIYRYDAAAGAVTTTHNGYQSIDAIAFSPANPEVMYLGITADAHN